MIKELYYGEIIPREQSVENEKQSKFIEEMNRLTEYLYTRISKGDGKKQEELIQLRKKYSCQDEGSAFAYGSRMWMCFNMPKDLNFKTAYTDMDSGLIDQIALISRREA